MLDKSLLWEVAGFQWFRSQVHAMGGGNYQTLINNALRSHIQHCQEPLQETLRRVLREEL